jgi:hypothetical protein
LLAPGCAAALKTCERCALKREQARSPQQRFQRSTTGQEHIGQQLIARQSRQVQAPGKGVDTVGGSAE